MNARSRLRRIAFTLVLICAIPLTSLHAQLKTKLRIATASPSLSYLPIYVAVKKGFFARRGFDVELIQMNASLTAPRCSIALLITPRFRVPLPRPERAVLLPR